LICPHCGNRVKPAIVDDNRLICPICHGEIAKIKPDSTLEFPSGAGEENGERAGTNEEKNREASRGSNEEANRGT